MDIENVKAIIDAVNNRLKSDYDVVPYIASIMDDLCDTIIDQLKTTDSIWRAQLPPPQITYSNNTSEGCN